MKNFAMEAKEKIYKFTHYIERHLFESVETHVEDAVLANLPTLFNEIQKFILENPWGNRQIGFLIGLLLLICGIFNVLFTTLTFNLPSAIVDGTVVIIGIFSVLIEYKVALLPTRIAKYLKSDWRFLFKPYGRPNVYVFGGLFIISQGDIIKWPLTADNILRFENFCVGTLVVLMSCVIHYHTYISSVDLEKIRTEHIDYTTLSRAFNAADKNGNGKLDTSEFITFLHSVNIQLTNDDLEAALQELDENHDMEINWKEFITWYERKEESLI